VQEIVQFVAHEIKFFCSFFAMCFDFPLTGSKKQKGGSSLLAKNRSSMRFCPNLDKQCLSILPCVLRFVKMCGSPPAEFCSRPADRLGDGADGAAAHAGVKRLAMPAQADGHPDAAEEAVAEGANTAQKQIRAAGTGRILHKTAHQSFLLWMEQGGSRRPLPK
jgi:hypothetical protein